MLVIQNMHEVKQKARLHFAAASCERDSARQNGLKTVDIRENDGYTKVKGRMINIIFTTFLFSYEVGHSKFYIDHPKTRRVQFSNGRFVSSCQMVRYLNGGLNPY